jgi:predicted acylesterase/phospholipase RssA
MTTSEPPDADLVLAAGGVKGIALLGATVALMQAGYRLNRVAGTSAGAIVAAIASSGLTGDELADIARSLNFRAPAWSPPWSTAACCPTSRSTASTDSTAAHRCGRPSG